MDQEVVAGLTGMHLGLIAAVLIAIVVLGKLLSGGKPGAGGGNPHVEAAKCGCGWSGSVSKYKRICPRCAAQIP